MPSGDSADALREVWMEGYNRGLSESGRKSAQRADEAQDEVARLACENAALRKRVEELTKVVRWLSQASTERDAIATEVCPGAGESVYAAVRRKVRELMDARKRVEELEQVINPALERLERAGWPCRLQELPDLYREGVEKFLEMQARAEKAERERDEARALLMRQQDITIDAYKNLDAAHACLGRILGTVRGSNLGYEIEALLEKRREGK